MGRQRLRVRKEGATFVHINVQLPADVFDRVKERAEETDRSMSNMVTVLLRLAFEHED